MNNINPMRGSAVVVIIIIICIIVVVGMVGYIFMSGSSHQTAASPQNSPSGAVIIPVKDFAPGLPASQKTTILLQTSDSSDIKYIVPTDQVDTYVKNLPEGYRVVSKTP